MRPSNMSKIPSLKTGQEFTFSYKKRESLPEHETVAEALPSTVSKNRANIDLPSSKSYSSLKTQGIQPASDDDIEEPVANEDEENNHGDAWVGQKRGRQSNTHNLNRSFQKHPKDKSSGESSEEFQPYKSTSWNLPKRKSRKATFREDDEELLTDSFVTGRQQLGSAIKSGQRPEFEQYVNGSVKSRTGSLYQDIDGLEAPALGLEAPTIGGFRSASNKSTRSNFVPPVRIHEGTSGRGFDAYQGGATMAAASTYGKNDSSKKDKACESTKKICTILGLDPEKELPDQLLNLDARMVEHICNEIMSRDSMVKWADIAGLEFAKTRLKEMVICPLLRPDLFQGTRAPGRGLLLYGPPGTGKTLIGKAIAGEAEATFFSISASSLTSKWIGDGEKLVRTLFAVASCLQPAVIFIDEIDSLLSQRKEDGEHESSRRLKTQFLIEMEGCSGGDDQVLLVGATNRPQELDGAVRRRLSNRLYIPLPEAVARAQIVVTLLQKDGLLSLSEDDVAIIARDTKGYSGSDMKNIVKEASMEPLREAMSKGDIKSLKKEDIRDICLKDFHRAIRNVKPSVAPDELSIYEEWTKKFGTGEMG